MSIFEGFDPQAAFDFGARLIAPAITGAAGWFLRGWWNPVVWTLTFEGDKTWALTRTTGRVARVQFTCLVPFDPPFLVTLNDLQTWGTEDVTDEMRWERQSYAKGEVARFIILGVHQPHRLTWYRGRKRFSALLTPFPGQVPIEVRKRNIQRERGPWTDYFQNDFYWGFEKGYDWPAPRLGTRLGDARDVSYLWDD